MRRLLRVLCVMVFLLLCSSENILLAFLDNQERAELDKLDKEIRDNPDVSIDKLERWEILLLKDPELLKARQREAIENWKLSQKARGEAVDEGHLGVQTRRDWESFMEKRRQVLMEINEQSVVEFLKALYPALQDVLSQSAAYPQELAPVFKFAAISADLRAQVYREYDLSYQAIGDTFTLEASPRRLGENGQKRFRLDQSGAIRFTLDGSRPTVKSYSIL